MIRRWRRIWIAVRHRSLGDLLSEVLPLDLRLHITFQTMGELTSRDVRLHSREVPTITVQELAGASKVAA